MVNVTSRNLPKRGPTKPPPLGMQAQLGKEELQEKGAVNLSRNEHHF